MPTALPSRVFPSRLRAALPILALLAMSITAPSAAVATDLPRVEGRIGELPFSYRAPATMQESLARMKRDDLPPIATFGSTTTQGRVGFRQLVIAKDRSAVIVALLLPPEMLDKLAPGTIDLGSTTREPLNEGSKDGWTSECPDKEEGRPTLRLEHFAPPTADAIVMPGAIVPAGRSSRVYETHLNRLRRDKATFEIRRVDPVAKVIEGRVSGEASWIVPKDPNAATNHPSMSWMCDAREYDVKVEPFDIQFTMSTKRR